MITQNLYFASCQTFQPNKCVRDDVHRNWPQTSKLSRSWTSTQEAVNMEAPCWKLLWDWYVSGFKLVKDQEWAKISVKSTSTKDVQSTSVRKKNLKSEKKYKYRRQAEYHHTLKGRKTLSSGVLGIRTLDLWFMKRVCYLLSYPSEWKTENK